MKKFVLILLSFCLFTQVVAQSNIKFQTIDRIEKFTANESVMKLITSFLLNT